MTLLLSVLVVLIAASATFGLMFWLGSTRSGPKVNPALLLRLIVVFVPTTPACYALLWFARTLFALPRIWPPLCIIATLLAAAAVTYFTCLHSSAFPPGLLSSVLLGAFVTGGFAVSAAFFGPRLFTPYYNQAAVLSALVIAPLGFGLGAIGGAFYWFAHLPRSAPPSHHGAA